MTIRSRVAIPALLSLFAALTARADIPVYASDRDDGFDTGVAAVNGPTLVHVWFDAGNTAATPGLECQPAGGGSEVCQWALQFLTTGNLVISDVAWNGSPIAPVEDDEPTSPAVLRAGTGGDAVLGQIGRRKIATVALSGTSGELLVATPTGMGFVDRNGAAHNVATVAGEAAGVHEIARAAVLPWRDISATQTTTCGVLGNGDLRCWGAMRVARRRRRRISASPISAAVRTTPAGSWPTAASRAGAATATGGSLRRSTPEIRSRTPSRSPAASDTEPSACLQLGAGVVALAGLARRRARRGGVR